MMGAGALIGGWGGPLSSSPPQTVERTGADGGEGLGGGVEAGDVGLGLDEAVEEPLYSNSNGKIRYSWAVDLRSGAGDST